MKVYISQREFDHEGFQIIGVFLNEDKAREACEKDEKSDIGQYVDSYSVSEYEVHEADGMVKGCG